MNGLSLATEHPREGYQPHEPRFMMMEGSHMSPTIRPGDYIAWAPVDGFRYDSLYLLDQLGQLVVFRCQNVGGKIRVTCDDQSFGRQDMTVAQFRKVVRGMVAMACKVLDRRLLEVAH